MIDIEKIVRQNIDNTVHMSLGTSANNMPWVCEVHFAYDKDLNLYFRSRTSRRHSQEIAANPNVAGNIVKQHALDEYPTGVYFEGTAKMLEPGDEQQTAYKCLSQRFGMGEEILADAANPDGHKFYKISVFDGQPAQKYQLPWNVSVT